MFSFSKSFFRRNHIFALLLSFLILPCLFTAARAAGEVDPTFNASIQRFANEAGISMAIQPDGKILVAGNFTYANLVARSAVARFNPDGTLDTSFDSGDLIGGTVGYIATVVKLQADGKILVGGQFTSIGGFARRNIARLNADGSVDTSFNFVDVSGAINDLEILPDGRILLAGSMTIQINGTAVQRRLVRLNADGALDLTFANPGSGDALLDIAVLPDGKILGGGNSFLHRFSAGGAFEFAYPVNGGVNTINILPNGQALIGGTFTFYNGFTQGRIARINADGTLDTSFNTNGVGFNGSVSDVSIAPDGRLIVVGSFTGYNNVNRSKVVRLSADGSLDAGFTYSPEEPNAVPVEAEAFSDGGAYILYNFTFANTITRRAFARLLTNGAVSDNFHPRLGTFGAVYKLLYLPDGKILVGGEFDAANGVLRRGLFRLNADGSFDQTFNISFTTNGFIAIINDIAPQPDGKFIIAGVNFNGVNNHPTQVLARINADGSTDTTFTSPLFDNSIVKSAAVEPDGKILIGGTLRVLNVGVKGALRLNPNGTIDTGFNPNINNTVNRLLRQPDGKILIGGEFTNVNGSAIRAIARLLADGTLDPSFNPPGGANDGVLALAFQPDGKVLIGGRFTAVNGINRAFLARLNANGTFDAGFTPSPNYYVYDIAVQPDGKILVGGEFIAISNAATNRYARLNPDGTLDTSFIIGSGANTFVFDIELQPDGKILLGGNFTRIQNQSRGGVARLLNANPPRAIFDYNGDGVSDISVFRPAAGSWYVARPTGVPSQNFDTVQFGVAGDQIVPADYDGDGKTDVAVWRPSDGTWYLMQSSAGFRAAQFGANGDIPVPGDFDGDGRANLAVFRPSTGSWYIARPTGIPSQNFDTVPFGANGDKPIVGADFDGDGKADVAVFRPSDGNWYRINSSTNQFVGIHFGISEDKPVAADYDGDGKTDLAVWRPSDGVWYRINSGTDTFTATQFGISTDRPVPADYDGDGKADLGVFRPAEGNWYLLRSTAGYTGLQFGAAGDIPTPNAYVR
jgi:uncharacterized delta-60 repeat protein